ncbi:transporter, major facilitator family protein [Staphylococcus epidermidis 14.1.R1.SE]|nr:transporter, major facilitator family protein [Staphylococcus epidermidis 14.1.R1.SE]
MPYLLIAGPIGAIVLVLLPNAGSFNFGYASLMALSFGAVMTLLMDLTSNACMQPYKMIIGDMVNEKQRDMAWSWQLNFFKFRWYYCYGITIFINNVGNE